MGKILESLPLTIVSGIVLTLIVAFGVPEIGTGDGGYGPMAGGYTAFMIRWLHVLAGVMWIGLLWYFNFVQIPQMKNVPDEQKPAISKHIAPEALFWFRWAALFTIIFGLALAHINGYLSDVLTLSAATPAHNILGVGMWFGIIMMLNVWGIIWPNQKKALGIVQVEADEKAGAARKAMLASRTNTLLSIPMLYGMVVAQNGGFYLS